MELDAVLLCWVSFMLSVAKKPFMVLYLEAYR